MTVPPELAMIARSPGGSFREIGGNRDVERAHELELLRREIRQRSH